jgi:hypothetical protein
MIILLPFLLILLGEPNIDGKEESWGNVGISECEK